MARKSSKSGGTPEEYSNNYSLTRPRTEAEQLLSKLVDEGNEIAAGADAARTQQDVDEFDRKVDRWSAKSKEITTRLFSNERITYEFSKESGGGFSMGGGPGAWLKYKLTELQNKVSNLQGVIERLEYIPEPDGLAKLEQAEPAVPVNTTDVFVVHGHDNEAKEAVARTIAKLGLNPIILHEQENKGQTLIEKLERFKTVAFAVVLLTPDDLGSDKERAAQALRGEADLSMRARQNVVLELGLFLGAIGRDRVMALKKGNIELPSDYDGVVYEEMDEKGHWKYSLGKELRAAGLAVDLNNL